MPQDGPIHAEMKVAHVIGTWPATVEIFLARGCPDMRAGFFSMMARLMTVRRAAWMHRLVLDDLIADLNRVAKR